MCVKILFRVTGSKFKYIRNNSEYEIANISNFSNDSLTLN